MVSALHEHPGPPTDSSSPTPILEVEGHSEHVSAPVWSFEALKSLKAFFQGFRSLEA